MTDAPQFRTVLRGLDPAQVDAAISDLRTRHDRLGSALEAARQEAGDRTVELSKAQLAHSEAQREFGEQLDAAHRRIAELETQNSTAANPTYESLGERIASMLRLADDEAGSLRQSAQLEAAAHREKAEAAATALAENSDRYSQEVRGKADAEVTRLLEDARKKADSIIDEADREAAARREEAEAFYENQRAAAASAAADFETTLAGRREASAQEFAEALAGHEANLSAVQSRAEQLAAESESAHAGARAEAETLLAHARDEAGSLVQQAKEHAARVRRDSDRELAAATARRDSINAQLTNVRQMLATLGGAALAQGHDLDPQAGAEPTDASPTEAEAVVDDDHHTNGDAQVEVDASGVEAEQTSEAESVTEPESESVIESEPIAEAAEQADRVEEPTDTTDAVDTTDADERVAEPVAGGRGRRR